MDQRFLCHANNLAHKRRTVESGDTRTRLYVLRKQMRHAARKLKAEYCAEVFEEFAEDVHHYVSRADLSQTHVYDRLVGGKLINV